MPVVMKLLGYPDGSPTPHDGEYLRSFDFGAFGGVGLLATTPDKKHAKRFETMEEALGFLKTSPVNRLFRADGQPNRPLTATNWEFETLEEEEK